LARQIPIAVFVTAAYYSGCAGNTSPVDDVPIWGETGSSGMSALGGSTALSGGAGGTLKATGGKGGKSGRTTATAGKSGTAGKGGTKVTGQGGNGGSGGQPGQDDAGSGCPTSAPSNCEVVNASIVIRGGETRDYQCKCVKANAATLGDGDQGENQQPVFVLESGAKLLNVIIGSPAADGIHCEGDATLENIVWTDIGEDAMTIKKAGNVTLNGGYAANGSDKIFQINAASTFKVSNFKAHIAGKFIRQNGNTTFKVAVEIDNCDISNMNEAIFRTDSSSSTVKMTNTRYSNIGKQLFVVPSSSQVTASNNTEY
jgi:pectate lyase C